LDRRTNGPEGSGGASPTIVTSWAGDDVDNDEETLVSEVIAAPPKRTPRTPAAGAAPVTTAPANGDVADHKANGAAAASDAPVSDAPVSDAPVSDAAADQETGTPSAVGPAEAADQGGTRSAETDVTRSDIPALPADQIRPARGTRPSARVSPATDSPASGDAAAASSAKAAAEDPSPTMLPSSSPFGPTSSGTASVGSSLPGDQTPTVSPAAFAWEMPDSPPDSPPSAARGFLGAGTNAKSAIASRTPGMTGPGTGRTQTGEVFGSSPRSGPKKASSKRTARQAHLTVARVEPWSVMKFSFVVSLVAFVVLFVAVSLLYGALDGLGVFDSLQRVVTSLTSSQGSAGVNASKWFSASRVLGYTALLGSLNIVLITAMSTIGSVVYNLTSRLVGGVEVTLRESDE
jgi:hypothetical protein